MDSYFQQEQSRLADSSHHLDEYIQMGRQSLQELYEQRDILKVILLSISK